MKGLLAQGKQRTPFTEKVKGGQPTYDPYTESLIKSADMAGSRGVAFEDWAKREGLYADSILDITPRRRYVAVYSAWSHAYNLRNRP